MHDPIALQALSGETAASVASSPRVAEVSLRFGLPLTVVEPCVTGAPVPTPRPGEIVALVGPSGSGKSTALAGIERRHAAACNVHRLSMPTDRAIVDCVIPGSPLTEALSVLSACALGEPRLWLRRYHELSDGEKFRAKLACAIGLLARTPAAPLLSDEFCTGLHRRAARAVAHNLRKLVTRRRLSMVLATPDERLLADLQPDVTVRLQRPDQYEILRRAPRRHRVGFWRRLTIESGAKQDYRQFSAMHYRRSDALGFVDKIFVLREKAGGTPLGIVVYAYAPIQLALRNAATARRYCRNPRLLNREVRILRRLVIHPDVRGCGLGHGLVRRTLPWVGTRFVECLASMGALNPVFEKAGMRRIGTSVAPRSQAEASEALDALGVDPFAPDFERLVCRSPRVRRIVGGVVLRWYEATTGGGGRRVERQSPRLLAQLFRALVGSRPVYYLWDRDGRLPSSLPQRSGPEPQPRSGSDRPLAREAGDARSSAPGWPVEPQPE